MEEDHPDNLAAALFGGFTVAWLESDGFGDAVRMDVHPDVQPLVMVPQNEVPTKKARAMLPASVPFGDAAINISRSALLVHALTQDPSRLMTATEDRLHQQARQAAYPDSVDLLNRLRSDGVPAVISGAGPSVLAFVDAQSAPVVAAATGGSVWTAIPVAVSAAGAREVPLPPMG